MPYAKYRARKVTVGNITFDSKKEAKRWETLLHLETVGDISNLQRQVKYVLIPAQRDTSTEEYKRGPKKGQKKPGKLLEKECAYYADFVYEKNGKTIVEDTKGVRLPGYVIKRKLMLYVHGIAIKEI